MKAGAREAARDFAVDRHHHPHGRQLRRFGGERRHAHRLHCVVECRGEPLFGGESVGEADGVVGRREHPAQYHGGGPAISIANMRTVRIFTPMCRGAALGVGGTRISVHAGVALLCIVQPRARASLAPPPSAGSEHEPTFADHRHLGVE